MKSRSATEQAIGYLARREHSSAELQQKLQQAGHETDKIHAALEKLQQSGLQNDERFAEAFIRSRILRGYGELRIRQEMKQKGVADALIHAAMQQVETDWFALAIEVRCKRFGSKAPMILKTEPNRCGFYNIGALLMNK